MTVSTHLMFEGAAEAAIALYVRLIPGSSVLSVQHYGEGEPGAGLVRHAVLDLAGTTVQCIDSPVAHAFTFTPATSLFVDFDTREQFDHAFGGLSEDGGVLMPPGDYGFSPHFAWVQDRYGVSWQLNLPA